MSSTTKGLSSFRFFANPVFDDRGTSMLEFALIVPVLLMIIFGLVDIARYIAAESALTQAADLALNLAEKAPNLDVDLSTMVAASGLYSNPATGFAAERHTALSAGINFALSTYFSAPGTGGMIELRSFQQRDDVVLGPRWVSENALLLRPGETATDDNGDPVDHPTLCAKLRGCAYGDRDPADPNARWRDILHKHPFVVEFRATFRPISFIFGNFQMDVFRVGQREVP